MEITEYDKALISKARRLSFYDWEKAFELARQAQSDEARETLRRIAKNLYHKEEYYNGLL